jgi:ATP-dependent 26S proteasome regulatory subunit
MALAVSTARGQRAAAQLDAAALSKTQLLGFGSPPVVSTWRHDEVVAHLEQSLNLIGAWCMRALAAGWDSGRIAYATGTRPFAEEAGAILGGASGRAAQSRSEAEERVAAIERSCDLDAPSPLSALSAEYGLSPLAQRILLVVAAPQLRGELARGYALVANDPARPTCDELLVCHILDAHGSARRQVAHELNADAPLVRHGLILVGNGTRPYVALSALPVVAQRIAGEVTARGEPDELAVPRVADRELCELRLPFELVERAVAALAPRALMPARIVVRAPAGTGGTALLAALARQAGRALGIIDASVLAARGSEALAQLGVELRRTWLRGLVPCLVSVDALLGEDAARRAAFNNVLARHGGPIAFRTALGAALPVYAPTLLLDMPHLSETARLEAWHSALARANAPHDCAERLATKYRVGPGTIERVVRTATAGAVEDLGERIERALRDRRESHIRDVATRVSRLARWDNIVLPGDVLDSIREFIGRIVHRRTVFDRWGYDRLLTSGRGLTALFSGGPGTGKSLVAGVIARELGYELYRIDLSRVLSKWVGETEKNLARVFDAAEDGEVVLLFDEADSLFTKRTPNIRSANDRYSNLEVNFLLERLDQFDGVAILTTNADKAIDPAFKRRLSFRLTFPFPDEDMREQLWRVHIPTEVPRHGELDTRALATRYKLSGGYIRNAALRAAFLAAQESRPLSHDHLERAVQLEYREVGRLSNGGVLE